MLVTLPVAVGKLVDLCSRGDSRYSGTAGVQVTDCENGLWRCAATDGRFMAVIQGHIEVPGGYEPDGLAEAGCKTVIVPADAWKEIFKGKGGNLVIVSSDSINIVLERCQVAMVNRTVNTRAIDGRFPPYQHVIPKIEPTAFIHVDPGYLADIAKVAESIIKDDENHASVQFGFYPNGNTGLFGMTGRRQLDPTILFDGLLVPLEGKKDEGKTSNGQPHKEEAAATE